MWLQTWTEATLWVGRRFAVVGGVALVLLAAAVGVTLLARSTAPPPSTATSPPEPPAAAFAATPKWEMDHNVAMLSPAICPPELWVQPDTNASAEDEAWLPDIGFSYVPAGVYRMGLSRPYVQSGHLSGSERQTFRYGPPRWVARSIATFVGQTEVTVGLWRAVLGATPTHQSVSACGDACPVDGVTWWSALAFADALNDHLGLPRCYDGLGVDCTGTAAEGTLACTLQSLRAADYAPLDCQGYRLPTDVEWEAAARGGTTTETYLGNRSRDKFFTRGEWETPGFGGPYRLRRDESSNYYGPNREALRAYAAARNAAAAQLRPRWRVDCYLDTVLRKSSWYCHNAHTQPVHCLTGGLGQWLRDDTCVGAQAVGQLAPNAYRLYDMLGNTREWVWDGFPKEVDDVYAAPAKDPVLLPLAAVRATRGGHWNEGDFPQQAGVRTGHPAHAPAGGLRLARTAHCAPPVAALPAPRVLKGAVASVAPATAPADATVGADVCPTAYSALVPRGWGWPMLTAQLAPRLSYIPAGHVSLGGQPTPVGSPWRPVQRTFATYVGQTEVTVGLWREVMGQTPRHQPLATCGDQCPVDGITWWSALAFLDALNDRLGLPRCYAELGDQCLGDAADGTRMCWADEAMALRHQPRDCIGYRLPTDVEWEAAARGPADRNGSGAGSGSSKFDARWSDRGNTRGNRARGPSLDAVGSDEAATRAPDPDAAWANPWVRTWDYWNVDCDADSELARDAWYCANARVPPTLCAHASHRQRLLDGGCVGPQAVGQLRANGYGLFDMLGNAAEWVWDGSRGGRETRLRARYAAPLADPIYSADAARRVVRGGSWNQGLFQAHPGMRGSADAQRPHAGFRIARTAHCAPPAAASP